MVFCLLILPVNTDCPVIMMSFAVIPFIFKYSAEIFPEVIWSALISAADIFLAAI